MFDVAVVGGGITGCMSAYFAKKAGLSVVIYEKDGICSKASGAAGAFISPRIGKGGILQMLTNEAFEFAVAFYAKNFPSYFFQSGIYRIAKDAEDAKNYKLYSKKLSIKHNLTKYKDQEAIFFESAGAVDAKEICNALVKDIEVIHKEVSLEDIDAKHIILATGADKELLDLDFIGLAKTWGVRLDTKTKTFFKHTLHKNLSISATKDGIVRIGATHEKKFDDVEFLCEKGTKELLQKASALTGVDDFKVINHLYGTRSAVRDYFPIAGRVVDVKSSLLKYPMIKKGISPRDGLIYHKNCYIVGGTGGRGFVFSPYIANELIELITKDKEVDKRINPDRLFYKWARKLNE